MPRILALLPCVILACASGCASRSGYERASATADKTADYRDRVVRLSDQVGLALDGLRALAENPGDSPRSNRETFQTFERELANLESLAKSSRKTYGRMDARAERFFGGWTEESAEITDADLKKSAEQRRAALQSNYEKLAEGQREADHALALFVDELTDLRSYLEHDLTAAGLDEARPTVEKAFVHGAEIRERLDALALATDDARESLTPLRALAPSQQRAGGDSRVR